MKSRQLGIAALVLSLVTQAAGAATCTLDMIEGSGKLDLSEYKGRYVYVDFWASWCGPCKQSFPFMNDLTKQFDAKQLAIVAVSVDKNVADARDFLKDHPANFTVAKDIDGKCAKELLLKGMPSSYILGKNGEVLYTHKGFRPSDRDAITKQLQQLTEI